jgi:hypothetical protein
LSTPAGLFVFVPWFFFVGWGVQMQYARFSNGGYVLHRLKGRWVGRVSAWFDSSGKLQDVEHFTREAMSSGRSIKWKGPMWVAIQSYGGPLNAVLPMKPCGSTEFLNAGGAA